MCMDDTIRKMGEIEAKILDMVGMETAAGLAPVDAKELGEAVDMLKDLAEAKYYCSIVAAMEAEREPMRDGGEAVTGRDGGEGRAARQNAPQGRTAYDRYQSARTGYQAAKTAPNKRMMDEAAADHLQEVMDSVAEIWADADAGQRVQMKNALVGFVNGLK